MVLKEVADLFSCNLGKYLVKIGFVSQRGWLVETVVESRIWFESIYDSELKARQFRFFDILYLL